MSEAHELLSDTARDALGYVGGGILALSLVPQIIKLVMTKSAEDISLMWSLLYFLGTSLSFLYLVLIGALAAWIPVVVEMCGCIITITLKLMYDHTDWGRQQQLELEMELEKQDEMEAQRLVLQTISQKSLCPTEQPKVFAAEDSANSETQQPIAAKQQQHQQLAGTGQQQDPEQQLQPQQTRSATKKRVVINVPLTTAEEVAAAEQTVLETGDVVLTVGVKLPGSSATKSGGPCVSLTAVSSAASSAMTSTATSPRSAGAPVTYADNSAGAPVTYADNSFRHWHPAGSARRLPWYMTTGISHHSVLKPPQSPRAAAAAACRCPTCGHRCLPPDPQPGPVAALDSRRAWGNALFDSNSISSSVASAAATPHNQPTGNIFSLSGFSRRLARSLSRFGSGRSSRMSAAASQSATPEASSPGRAGAAGATPVTATGLGWSLRKGSAAAGLGPSLSVEPSALLSRNKENSSSSNEVSPKLAAGSSKRVVRFGL